MFRILPKLENQATNRTFENVRQSLEPTLYAKHLDFVIDDVITDFDGHFFPIPFHFDPATGLIKQAWQIGSMDIRHLSTGITRTITAIVLGAAIGSAPVVLSTVTMALGGAAVLQQFTDYLTDLDISAYDAIGMRYTIDLAPASPIPVSTAILWRPKLV